MHYSPSPQHHLPVCNKCKVIKTKAESLSDYGMQQESRGPQGLTRCCIKAESLLDDICPEKYVLCNRKRRGERRTPVPLTPSKQPKKQQTEQTGIQQLFLI